MTPEQKQQRIEEIRERRSRITAPPWMLQDSCSWRRIGTAEPYGDGNVICPITQRGDNHPDLLAKREDLQFVEKAPDDIDFLLSLVKSQEASDEASDLALAIASAAIKAGIVKGDQPLTGPQLLLLCDDLASIAVSTLSASEAETVGHRLMQEGFWRAKTSLDPEGEWSAGDVSNFSALFFSGWCAAINYYHRGEYPVDDTAVEIAATSMRSACVEKLKQIAADYDNVAQPNNGAAISKQALLYAARQLESLSIEKPKE